MVPPDIGHRQRDVFRERTRPIDSHAGCVRAQMTPAGETVSAASANHMALAADDVTGEEIHYIRSNLDDLPDKFMADRHGHGDGLLRPSVPFVNMHVRTADPGT